VEDVGDGLVADAFERLASLQGSDVEQLAHGLHERAVKQPHQQLGYHEAQQKGQVQKETYLHL
jgi:hypothetical protein